MQRARRKETGAREEDFLEGSWDPMPIIAACARSRGPGRVAANALTGAGVFPFAKPDPPKPGGEVLYNYGGFYSQIVYER